MAIKGTVFDPNTASACLISSDPPVQSAKTGITPLALIRSRTFGVSIASLVFTDTLASQYAVKLTITVLPCDVNLSTCDLDQGFQSSDTSPATDVAGFFRAT